jgi:hypothetical protein
MPPAWSAFFLPPAASPMQYAEQMQEDEDADRNAEQPEQKIAGHC